MDSIVERRLRPLYDLIDIKNYKGAIKQANTLLQKHPDSVHVKLVKALALERSGRLEEALDMCRQVKDAAPVDERILNDLYHVFSRLGHVEESTATYEKAASLNPGNPNFEAALFSAYVREENYVKQQQVAMKMYKRLGDEKTLMWAVCAIDLQAMKDPGKGNMFLSLAEAMVRKRIESHGLEKHESLLVYLHILCQQGKASKALEVVNGNLGDLYTIVSDKLRMKGDLLLQLGRFQEASVVYDEILHSNTDDWEAAKSFLDSVLENNSSKPTMSAQAEELESKMEAIHITENGNFQTGTALPKAEAESRLSSALNFFRELQILSKDKLHRGPHLAELEVEKRRLELELREKDEEAVLAAERQLAEAILSYFSKFGHLVSFASDVKEYTLVIKSEARDWLGSMLVKSSEEDEDSLTNQISVKELRRLISARQVFEQLGIPAKFSEKDFCSWGQRLVRLYGKTLHLSEALEPKEVGYGDELLSMAANCLVEAYCRTRNLAFLTEAVLVLEKGLVNRPFNPQYKLALVSLYCLLGAPVKALQIFQTLDIKHVLLETLSHNVLPTLLQCGQWEAASSLFQPLGVFHEDHRRDGPELLNAAYRNGTFSKVREFVEFKETLERSHQRLQMRLESCLSTVSRSLDESMEPLRATLGELGFGCPLLELASDDKLQKLTFNEDLATRMWWWPYPHQSLLPPGTKDATSLPSSHAWHTVQTKEAREKAISECKRFAKRRSMLPRLLSLALHLESDSPKESVAEFEQLVAQLTALQKAEGTHQIQTEQVDVEHPVTSAQFESLVFQAALYWSKSRLQLREHSSDESPLELFTSALHVIGEHLKMSMSALTSAAILPLLSSPLKHMHTDMEDLSSLSLGVSLGLPRLADFVIQDVSFLTCLLCHWSNPPKSNSSTKKKKKSKGKSLEEPSMDVTSDVTKAKLKVLVTVVVGSLEKTSTVLRNYLAQPVSAEVAAHVDTIFPTEISLSHDEGALQTSNGVTIKALAESMQTNVHRKELSQGHIQKSNLEPSLREIISSQRGIVKDLLDSVLCRVKLLKSLHP